MSHYIFPDEKFTPCDVASRQNPLITCYLIAAAVIAISVHHQHYKHC